MKNNSIDFQKISLYKTAEDSPGYLLLKVSLEWRSMIEDALKQFDLTHPQFIILATAAWLTQGHEKISQIDISRTVGLDPNTTSQILRGLEKKKLIKRTRSLNERSKSPILTTIGLDVLTQALPAVEATDQFFFDRLNESEMAQFMYVFKKLMKYSDK
ncbi:MarR family transcriptional regulator [Candidatus Babeliales bacterium]|nr:MarR family transcriptional regulator [Candidatus Babeliales bacterium]MBP9844360.1 MarR family transcriptional regulator [Candidatus Babeliales bacterium]